MKKAHKDQNFMVVDLTETVLVRTQIPSANHAALRSGFAGYPTNPRWNGAKVQAWKTGRQWREGLERGDLKVRPSDSMLVPAIDQEEHKETTPTSWRFQFPLWFKQEALTS